MKHIALAFSAALLFAGCQSTEPNISPAEGLAPAALATTPLRVEELFKSSAPSGLTESAEAQAICRYIDTQMVWVAHERDFMIFVLVPTEREEFFRIGSIRALRPQVYTVKAADLATRKNPITGTKANVVSHSISYHEHSLKVTVTSDTQLRGVQSRDYWFQKVGDLWKLTFEGRSH